jgi:hypothetical protein
MSKHREKVNTGAMLELWRPPHGAGDALGCLCTTYTFNPGLFDEQCLARFLDIESEPNREDFAYLLERESKLGVAYVGVLVDQTQAGVEHSLRWDVLPVRVPAGKQHAKLSLLAWSNHIRIIVASANLTEPGYRTNHEVAGAIDLAPDDSSLELLSESVGFLRSLLAMVPGASDHPPEVARAEAFLKQVEHQAREWKERRGRQPVRQFMVFTLPAAKAGSSSRGSLNEAVDFCRRRGASPHTAWIASPFFEVEAETSRVMASLCKMMGRGVRRDLRLCVPGFRDGDSKSLPQLAAPKSLLTTSLSYGAFTEVDLLPDLDADKNLRPWHAKMLALRANEYFALMIGSSNFTGAGMGIQTNRNAEANLLTVIDRVSHGKDIGRLESVWPQMEHIDDPETAEWLGAQPDQDEEQLAAGELLPAGFVSATYRAGDARQIVLRLIPEALPESWSIHACGQSSIELLSSTVWTQQGRPSLTEIPWAPILPPEKLLVRWDDHEAFMVLNVEDSRVLPPPAQLETMSADEMLLILAAADPGAAFRIWARRQQPSDIFDPEVDSATPIDLDPLKCYDLQATFLHRIRRRARILAQLRGNLQRPVWSRQSLEWRLRGFIGVEPLADRLLREFESADGKADEVLLTLADFLIVLRETTYQPADGSLSKAAFEEVFRPFLAGLADKLAPRIEMHRGRVSAQLMDFWDRVVNRCRE